ncbi:MAG: alpha/beta hydrolase [Christensenellaceae bacterium]|nr:alpha/beta hydrolase [Christensenellaceae bacterium]
MKITKVKNPEFTNKRTVGAYESIAFDTYLELPGGKEEITTVELNVHYCEKGEGPVILMLHGAGQSYYTYRNNIGPLSQGGYKVIAIDLPGHGYSDCPDMAYTVEEMSLCIEAFLKAKGIEKLTMVGCGQGAIYAMDYACYHPDQVEDVVVIHPGSLLELNTGLARQIKGPFGNRAVMKTAKEQNMRKLIEDAYFDKTIVEKASIAEYSRPLEDEDVRTAVRLAVCNFDMGNLTDRLTAYPGRVLAITAVDDLLHDAGRQEELIAHAMNAYSLTVRNCGWLIHEEKAQNVNKGILEFLKK